MTVEFPIKLLNLTKQRVVRDYGSSLSVGEHTIVYKVAGKFQDLTSDKIEDGEPYTTETTSYFPTRRASCISIRRCTDLPFWKISLEFAGVGEILELYFEKQADADSIADAILKVW